MNNLGYSFLEFPVSSANDANRRIQFYIQQIHIDISDGQHTFVVRGLHHGDCSFSREELFYSIHL